MKVKDSFIIGGACLIFMVAFFVAFQANRKEEQTIEKKQAAEKKLIHASEQG